ncbi:putative methyltransferase DDB_G0268948 [Apostichopus japonicus]|uniref:putative methyltransferase DDB_G0268948 n=1 Tax=Stichopus japonicus TaxID=307972 RepID=UPI003AB447E3
MSERHFEDSSLAENYEKYRLQYTDLGIEDNALTFLREELKEDPQSLAVDVGCGTGQFTVLLAPRFSKVIGVDCSSAQISVAKQKAIEGNLEYREGVAEHLPFLGDNSVDLVTTMGAMQYFDAPQFLAEVHRVLKPRGCLMIGIFDVTNLSLHADTEGKNSTVNERCTSLCREIVNVSIQQLGENAQKMFYTVDHPSPDYPEFQSFSKRALKHFNGVHEFEGFMKSFGGLRTYLQENPNSTMINDYKERLTEILGAVFSSPKTTPLAYAMDLKMSMYRKP